MFEFRLVDPKKEDCEKRKREGKNFASRIAKKKGRGEMETSKEETLGSMKLEMRFEIWGRNEMNASEVTRKKHARSSRRVPALKTTDINIAPHFGGESCSECIARVPPHLHQRG